MLTLPELALDVLGSVNAPPPLDHRQSGVGWSWSLVSWPIESESSRGLNLYSRDLGSANDCPGD